MGKLKVGDKTYGLEAFSHPSEVEGKMQSTFLVTDPDCLDLFRKMEKTQQIKKFKAKGQRGRIKGTFQVKSISGGMVNCVCIVRFYKYDYKQKTLDGH